jgi:protein O-GlcNAc transferase
MSDVTTLFKRAVTALNNRDMRKAEDGFRRTIRQDPSHVPALNLLTVVLMSERRFGEAEPFIARAVALNASSDVSFYNHGLILKHLNKPQQAYEQFTKALKLNSGVPETWNNRGTTGNDLKQYELAISDFDTAIRLNRNYPEAYANKGKSLFQLDRHGEALSAYDRALAIKPDLAEAWLGRGNVLVEFKRFEEALQAYDRALAIRPNLEDAWLGRGAVFTKTKRYNEAFAAYDRALSIKPDLAEAWLGRGNVLSDIRRFGQAFAAYDKALAITPDLEGPWLGRGWAFTELKRHDEAFAAFGKALELRPTLAAAWVGRGNLFTDLKQYEEALFAYDRALALRPDLDGVEGVRLSSKMRACRWENVGEDILRLEAGTRDGKVSSPPFMLLTVTDNPEDHLSCARAWVKAKHPAQPPPWQGSIYRHDRIRIGYVSADLSKHATAHLMAEMFELHDRRKFELAAFSIGADDGSAMRQRLMSAFDSFVDCQNLSDADISDRIRQSEIDVLVDLKGFTEEARTDIFASRPAPIQVNYLGYPGTMGAPFIDYIIGDHTLFDASDAANYAEKLVRLPHCYQPNDRKRQIAERAFSREECGLPRDGIVFCCFNNNYKILPDVFDCWMRILGRVEGSALWLLEDNPAVVPNLRREAERRGIDPNRLVFAARVDSSDHLARHRLADLFLDTLPYNAHTTASDALWAGVPVLTQVGDAFAGRVAASLLKAVALPELITHSCEAYEALAIELALDRNKLMGLKEKLQANRLTTPLFDTALFTRHLEAAYETMYQRYRAGLPPDHVNIQATDETGVDR